MEKIVFTRPFRWSPDGHTIEDYGVGPAEVPARCAEVAVEAGAAEAPKPATAKARSKK